jgi:hypothetical protein
MPAEKWYLDTFEQLVNAPEVPIRREAAEWLVTQGYVRPVGERFAATFRGDSWYRFSRPPKDWA